MKLRQVERRSKERSHTWCGTRMRDFLTPRSQVNPEKVSWDSAQAFGLVPTGELSFPNPAVDPTVSLQKELTEVPQE